MAQLILYGSTTANGTLPNACNMANASGGVETSVLTTFSGGGSFYNEVSSQPKTLSSLAAIPAPTGNGWVYQPGAGTFALGNWSAVTSASSVFAGSSDWTMRFSLYSGGIYTTIGSINTAYGSLTTRHTNTFAATSMPATVFGASDLLYIDIWWHDTTGVGGDNPTFFVSTSSTAGVAGDMVVTTSNFTPGAPIGPYSPTQTIYTGRGIESTLVNVVALRYIGRGIASTLVARYIPRGLLGTLVTPPVAQNAMSSTYYVGRGIESTLVLSTNSESLVASDAASFIDAATFIESNTATESSTVTDSATFTEANTASDSFIAQDGYNPVEANTAVDSGTDTRTFTAIDALSGNDSLAVGGSYNPIEALSVVDSLLDTDTFSAIEANSANDSASSMVSGPAGGGPANNNMTGEDDLVASDMGNLRSWPVENLTASDSMSVTQIYSITEPLVVSDVPVYTDTFKAVEALSIVEIASMVSAAAGIVTYSYITVQAARGNITMQSAGGALTATGSNGNITATGARGTITVQGDRGTITEQGG